MTFAEFASYIRKQTGTNTTTFTNADILLYANIFKDEISKEIVRSRADYFGVPATANLEVVDGVRIREYPLDNEMFWQIKHVAVYLDGKWVQLKELDLLDYRGSTDENTILSKFSNAEGSASYDLFRGSLWLYTGVFTPVTAGIKMWTFSWPIKFTDLTLTSDMSVDPNNTGAGFPREFHELLGRRVIIAKKGEGDKPKKLTDHELAYNTDLTKALSNIERAREQYGSLPSENQWGNGFNL